MQESEEDIMDDRPLQFTQPIENPKQVIRLGKKLLCPACSSSFADNGKLYRHIRSILERREKGEKEQQAWKEHNDAAAFDVLPENKKCSICTKEGFKGGGYSKHVISCRKNRTNSVYTTSSSNGDQIPKSTQHTTGRLRSAILPLANQTPRLGGDNKFNFETQISPHFTELWSREFSDDPLSMPLEDSLEHGPMWYSPTSMPFHGTAHQDPLSALNQKSVGNLEDQIPTPALNQIFDEDSVMGDTGDLYFYERSE